MNILNVISFPLPVQQSWKTVIFFQSKSTVNGEETCMFLHFVLYGQSAIYCYCQIQEECRHLKD